MPTIYSETVNRLLQEAGWRPGRKISTAIWESDGAELFPAARAVLSEFGGLHIGAPGPGIDFAASDVDLRYQAPTRPTFRGYPELEQRLGRRLYSLGEVHRGNAELLIDEAGHVYDLVDDLRYLGSTFASALEGLLLGIKPR